MNSLGVAVLDLTADDTQMVADIDKAKSTALQNLNQFGNDMKQAGQTMTAGFTLPFLAVATSSFMLAADLQDALGATDQIYKNSANEVKAWAESLETYYGIAESEALQYANMMGTMLQNIGGLSEDEAARQASALIELAGDLTAMYGGTTADAVRALTGALKGNNTMLDNYGMVATDDMIKTKALELALWDGEGALSASAKQAATLALIMEQAAAAQGQAAREADGGSGSLRAQITEMKNLGASIGQILLPVGIQLLTFFRDLLSWFQKLTPEQQKWILIIGAVVAAIGPLLMIIGSLITAITAIIPVVTAIGSAILPILPIILAVIAVVALLWLAWKNNFAGMGDVINGFISIVKSLWQALLAFLRGDTDAALGHLRQAFETYVSVAKSQFERLKTFVTGVWTGLTTFLKSVWQAAWDAVVAYFQNRASMLMGTARQIVQNIRNAFNINWSELGKKIIDGIVQGIKNGTKAIVEAAKAAAKAALDAAKAALGIKSPSTAFMEIGNFTGMGFVQGLQNSMTPQKVSPVFNRVVGNAAQSMTRNMNNTINVFNPVAEPASNSVDKTLKKLSYLGIIK